MTDPMEAWRRNHVPWVPDEQQLTELRIALKQTELRRVTRRLLALRLGLAFVAGACVASVAQRAWRLAR